MNNFINWVAVNNTLMIRIGFTAILALVVIYIFRLFFLPKVNIIGDSIESEDTGTVKPSNVLDEAELEKRRIVEEKQAQHYNLEIEKHLIEVASLKDQLIDTSVMVQGLKEKNLELTIQVNSAIAAAPISGEVADTEYVAELKSKVENLETRLSEYEIIAEDISEIGQLRKEIAELRKQADKPVSEELLIVDETVPEEEPEPEATVDSEFEAAPESEAEIASEPELVVEAAPLNQTDEAELADLISTMERIVLPELATEEVIVEEVKLEDLVVEEIKIEDVKVEDVKVEEASALVKFVSDKVVSANERDMIDHFEEITKKRGS